MEKVVKSEQEWREQLTPEQYEILRNHGTERPFTGRYVDTKEDGTYCCAACGNELFSADTKFDCEAWIPSQGRYRELTSTSNTTDYQARRLGCRYRPAEGAAPEHVATLNGTAVAVGRTLIAIIENRQDADGSVSIPPALVEQGAPAQLG